MESKEIRSRLEKIIEIANPCFAYGKTVSPIWTFKTREVNNLLWDRVSYGGSKSIKISICDKTKGIAGLKTPAVGFVEIEPDNNIFSQTSTMMMCMDISTISMTMLV